MSLYYVPRNEENQTRFYVCFAVAIAAAIGVAFAGNLLTLFVFYETLKECFSKIETKEDETDGFLRKLLAGSSE